MKKLFICISILSLGFIIFGCDETSAPASILDDVPAITHIQIQPRTVEFTTEEDGFKDTTLSLGIYVSTINVPDDQAPLYIVSNIDSGEEIASGSFDIIDSGTGNFGAEVPVATSTTSFEKYIVHAFTSSENDNGNFAQTTLYIIGISNSAPQILETNNPDKIQLPSSGSQNVAFAAKVTDQDGQETIENVFMRLISQNTGEIGDSPFTLYDDGTNGGDETANDSLYTLTLQVSDQNQPDSYSIEYFAIDQGGLVSDTVTSTFNIIE